MVNWGLIRGTQAISLAPAQPVLGAPARPVFRADPALVAERIHRREYAWVIDLALVRLVARGHGRALQMADHRQMLLQAVEEVAAHDLHMIKIELDAQVRPADFGDDVGGVLDAVEEIIRPVEPAR